MPSVIKHIFMAAVVLAGLAGCKKVPSDCEVIITPRVIPVQSSPPSTPAYMVRIYSYYIAENDIENWAPATYADADAGIVRHKQTGATKSHDLMGEQQADTYVHFTFSQSPVLLMAVDPLNKCYAWREFEFGIPVHEPVIMVLRFLLYKTDQYLDSKWTIVNEPQE